MGEELCVQRRAKPGVLPLADIARPVMLKALRQSDIDTIIQACGPDDAASGGEADDAQSARDRERVYELANQLSRPAQEELLALMWTGGPKNGNSFEDNLELAQKTRDENHAGHIAEQHARLPNYLRDGLRRLAPDTT